MNTHASCALLYWYWALTMALLLCMALLLQEFVHNHSITHALSIPSEKLCLCIICYLHWQLPAAYVMCGSQWQHSSYPEWQVQSYTFLADPTAHLGIGSINNNATLHYHPTGQPSLCNMCDLVQRHKYWFQASRSA